jgi:pimeloyl-ACP methyl ester carboxylesterase
MRMTEVATASGIRISVRHPKISRGRAVVVAPGFFQSKETRTFRRIENDLLAGFDVISMDFRGHGRSAGAYTFSAREAEDLKAVMDYARNHHEKVGVLGFSLGGSIAVIEQEKYKNIDSLVCVSSPADFGDVDFRWWTPSAFWIGVARFEPGVGFRPGNPFLEKRKPYEAAAALDVPALFIHGTGDPTVRVRHSQKLHAHAGGPKRIEIFEKGSHAEEIYRRYPERFMALVNEWFGQTLGGA